MSPLGVGLVGCGTISAVYLRNAVGFDSLRVVACSDVDPAAADRTAALHGLEACTTEELMRRADVDVVLCLTPPDWHAEVALAALAAGKHVYTEKPLATSLEDGRRVIEAATAAGRLVGAAPDTFLGAGLETVRAALADGSIGTPALAETHLLHAPPESWHPSPAFLYAERSGPLLDLGPYAVTAAVALLGPVRLVSALATRPRTTGTIESGPRAGTEFPIAEPTRVVAALEHEDGVLTTLTTTFDAGGPARHGVVIHGRHGTLLGGDLNTFDGPVLVRRRGEEDQELALLPGRRDNARGLGLDDLCRAIATGAEPRASGALALHVLEVLTAIRQAAADGGAVAVAPPPPARPDEA